MRNTGWEASGADGVPVDDKSNGGTRGVRNVAVEANRLETGDVMEEEEQGAAGQSARKASGSGQPMDVDNEAPAAVVDATKVAEEKEPEKEGEDQPSWDDVEEDTTL